MGSAPTGLPRPRGSSVQSLPAPLSTRPPSLVDATFHPGHPLVHSPSRVRVAPPRSMKNPVFSRGILDCSSEGSTLADPLLAHPPARARPSSDATDRDAKEAQLRLKLA